MVADPAGCAPHFFLCLFLACVLGLSRGLGPYAEAVMYTYLLVEYAQDIRAGLGNLNLLSCPKLLNPRHQAL